jgi:pimeloyl-ACP methyl ester carboxylesterase
MDSGRTYKKVTLENGEKIHYQEMNGDSSKPEVIMFVHGNLSNEAWWNDVMDEMKVEGYRMIALDLRGFG